MIPHGSCSCRSPDHAMISLRLALWHGPSTLACSDLVPNAHMGAQMIRRRDMLAGAAAAGALATLPADLRRAARAADSSWNAGLVAHLLPTDNHNRILLKVSLREPLKGGALLHLDGRPVA